MVNRPGLFAINGLKYSYLVETVKDGLGDIMGDMLMKLEKYQPYEIYQVMGRIQELRVSKVDTEIRVYVVSEGQGQSFKSIGMRTYPIDHSDYRTSHPFTMYWNHVMDGIATVVL